MTTRGNLPWTRQTKSSENDLEERVKNTLIWLAEDYGNHIRAQLIRDQEVTAMDMAARVVDLEDLKGREYADAVTEILRQRIRNRGHGTLRFDTRLEWWRRVRKPPRSDREPL